MMIFLKMYMIESANIVYDLLIKFFLQISFFLYKISNNKYFNVSFIQIKMIFYIKNEKKRKLNL